VVFSCLSSKINTCEQILNVISTRLVGYIKYFPELSSATAVNSLISDDVTVIINKLPPEVKNPARRKKLLDGLTGHESMTSVRAIREKLVIKLDKTVSKDFYNVLPNILENATAGVTACNYLGIAFYFSTYFDVLLFKECPRVEETVRIRNSRAVKQSFAYAQSLELRIRDGVKVKNFCLQVTIITIMGGIIKLTKKIIEITI